MKQFRIRLSAVIFFVFLTSMIIFDPVGVFAQENMCSLTLTKAVQGSSFSLYQIQKRNADGTYTTTKEFSKYPIDLKLTDTEKMREAASTLAGYVTADQITAYETKSVDEHNSVAFTDLASGLYLAMGNSVKVNGKPMEQTPILAYLPASSEDQRALYDLTVEVKSSPVKEKKRYKVYKVWDDNESKNRPKEIVVALYQDDAKYEEVTLNKSNDWSYTWENLEKDHKYTMVEISKPKGYKVKITEENGIFTVTNTEENTPPGNPPNNPPENPPNNPPERIPQTGQLWWPVAVLAALGIIFLAIGIWRRGRKE
ncbi:MAG: Cna B-type domain-containing protein [Eubacteriales bacterium]|nr:Cna B-type domain-containing protein [Eubacteriales bacterium]